LLHVMRRALDEAQAAESAAIVLDMDTPGGRVDVTETIMRLLLDLPEEIRSFTFIRKDALSAGALIAVATRDIYMAPGARIGASAIVGPGGDIEEGDLKEKHVSALLALVRSAAHTNGHDPDLFESMIRRDMEYTIDDETIVKEGQLLTLSAHEAARIVGTNENQRPLLSGGTVASIEEMLKAAGIENFVIEQITITSAERIARWVEMFAFLFLAGGLLGLYIEFRTPGFGFPGIAGIVLLTIFFWGHRIAGLSGDWQLIVFILGALLLLVEIFLIPGFGITGISGMVLMLIAIFFSMAAPLPETPSFSIPSIDLQRAIFQMALACVFTLGAGAVFTRYLPQAAGFRRLVLDTALTGRANDPEPADKQPQQAPSIQAGDQGITATQLRPSGYARINGQRVGVVAQGSFLDSDVPVKVISAQGNHIVVTEDHTGKDTNA
ncbi:MAG: NfeD family protein, partial [Kiritimatiellia bacterium]